MPVHDWTRVLAGTFHDFHQAWIVELRNALNDGLLPSGFYALADQVAGTPHPDVLTLQEHVEPTTPTFSQEEYGAAALAVAEHPPKVRFTLDAEATLYAAKADRVAIYHASGDRVIAFIEVVSPGNKHSQVAVTQFLDKLSRAVAQGCHLLVIDLHPPGNFDPQGLHVAFWGSIPGVNSKQPLSAAAYRALPSPKAYFEPIAVGAELPDMPLFLTSEHYINVPLASTYQAAWRGVPQRWKRVLNGSSPSDLDEHKGG